MVTPFGKGLPVKANQWGGRKEQLPASDGGSGVLHPCGREGVALAGLERSPSPLAPLPLNWLIG